MQNAGEAFEVEIVGIKHGIVRPEAINAVHELGIDISSNRSKHVIKLKGQRFDHVITVSDNAKENSPDSWAR